MKIEILDHAQADLVQGYRYYENKEAGLGIYFLDTLYSDIDSLSVYGGIHPKRYKNFNRALSKRFPFAIYYTVENDTVRIRSVVDCRKHPSWIRDRLTNA
jgi:hypothetical protein